MLVLFIHATPPDNAVHVTADGVTHVLRLAGTLLGEAAFTVIREGEVTSPIVRRCAGSWLRAGPALVSVLDVTPAGCRLGFDAPPQARIERDKIVRQRRASRV